MSFKVLSSKTSCLKILKIFIPLITLSLVTIILLVSSYAANAVKYVQKILPSQGSPTVIIDAGHGGFDGGAVVDGIMEKDVNLKIANNLSDFLKLAGYRVIQTRQTDSSTESDSSLSVAARKKSDLKNRLNIANINKDAIFVSIHLNKFSFSSANGAQIFYGIKNEGSKALAECIRKDIISKLQPDNKRTIKKGTKDTYLLYNSQIPSVIVECGFMSNKNDLENLLDPNYQQKIAFAVYCGIANYIDY